MAIVNQEIKRRAIHRLKIIGGQVKGLEKLVEQERYCIEIIDQSLAVREALMSLEKLILENHLSTHVAEQVQAGNTAKAVKEMLSIYNKLA